MERVRAGAKITVGMVSLEGAPPEIKENKSGIVAVTEDSGSDVIPAPLTKESINSEYKRLIDQQYFCCTKVEVIRERTTPKSAIYRVRVWVESYFDQPLDQIIRVTYRVWDDADQPIISTTARRKHFELWLSLYGEFPVLAYIERKGKPGVWVTRYHDLPGRPID